MRNIIKTLLLSVIVFGMNSCTEEKILNLSPINNIADDAAFSTPSLIESSMNGVYNAAGVGQYNSTSANGGRGYIWGAAFVEQGECRGEDAVNAATFYQLTYTATYDPTTANNSYYWIDGYRLINRCNLMIEGVTAAVASGTITQAVGNDYIGQAKFLRAITHFELLTYFARPYNFTAGATHLGIPYREVGINTQSEIDSEILKPRNTVAECYTKILADLNDAETLITTNTISKASKNAAIAFKTRVYLHKRDWPNVITEGSKLNTAYTLTALPSGVFTNNLANTESIFSIQHSATSNPGVNGALASMLKTRALVTISPIIWRNASWLLDDKRREEGVMIYTASGRKYTNKYIDATNLSDASPVIRYAEVLLNMAEANARLITPDLGTALTLLNRVRNRSLATPATQAYTAATLPTQTDMVKAILVERRIEFIMEGRRWSDIHRLQGDNIAPIDGIPAKIANGAPAASLFTLGTPYTGTFGVPAIPGSDYKFLWPIPQLELNTNPGLGQNPGW
ncbi:RagB/SusD family nutrient uptake outer membrane protein [Flavobacterium muglaense]|uniref:RagB/SusD family nutrient uptake outer membrane protein n=1 Tax=Flavobacterium muglaense TaxID=2764716 RepID=A0A923SDY4_9FLAO|nr:RagB/SusD family nutrient uptake outer membrane protein [Flavobacterium muglaense]MBC5836391.1 RagB/SusD family nutrient uptake outer membrane protein [Flavobacterium muglaense]MBC5842921.1 RagB/SusD family nutrient uptake outer membrane protein [Flavobacterium muglaense]